MGLFSDYRGNVRFWLRGYLLLGVAVLTFAMLIYSNHLISRMRDNAETTSRLFSRYIANVLFEVTDEGRLGDLRAVVRESNLPIVITVLDGIPILWHGLPFEKGIESIAERSEEEFYALIQMDVDNPPNEELRLVIELYREFDKVNEPIPIRVVGAPDVPQGYVHYGPSPLQRELRYMPFVQLAIFLVFMGIAIQGIRYLKLSEQRSIWVGLAKETAHQLGTPLSALLGWSQLIKDSAQERGAADILANVEDMEVDLARLSKVTDRFSKIGSQPALHPVNVNAVIATTAEYFRRRLPTRAGVVTVETQLADVPAVRGNAELLEWVFENLVKNALDAMGESGGRIDIETARADDAAVEIRVRDTGRGIPQGMRDRVFQPGFTTKTRGWGLGLALTRRIVEDYHDGSIRLADSRPGRGSAFVVRLPVA